MSLWRVLGACAFVGLVVTAWRLFDHRDWIVVWAIVGISAVRHLAIHYFGEEDAQQCPAVRAGCQCVHLEDHPGSHRDEFGDYWND